MLEMAKTKCPVCSTENEEGSKFCMECGAQLSGMEVISVRNIFSEEDTELIEKLIYNVTGTGSGTGHDAHGCSDQTIIALDDIANVPPDYRGSIRTTGKITFADGVVYKLEVLYRSGTSTCRAEALFRKAFVIRRVSDCILIQTDFGTYRITDRDLSQIQRRVFSRTPIVVVRENDAFYMMCEKRGGYVFGDDGPLDPDCIYQLVPLKEYGIGCFGAFRIVR